MKPTMPEEYHHLLHRYCVLASYSQRTLIQDAELAAVSAEMDGYEEAHKQESIFATVASDYADLRLIGDLGGCEIL